jgi:hypothetical protein
MSTRKFLQSPTLFPSSIYQRISEQPSISGNTTTSPHGHINHSHRNPAGAEQSIVPHPLRTLSRHRHRSQTQYGIEDYQVAFRAGIQERSSRYPKTISFYTEHVLEIGGATFSTKEQTHLAHPYQLLENSTSSGTCSKGRAIPLHYKVQDT